MEIWKRRHHVICNCGEEAPFYIARRHNFIEKTLDKVGEFFIDVQNYTGGWLKFNFMVQALPGGLVV